MTDRKTVMSWLEGLSQDDWAEWHSDSEVQTTAQAALDLLKAQEDMIPIHAVADWLAGYAVPPSKTSLDHTEMVAA